MAALPEAAPNRGNEALSIEAARKQLEDNVRKRRTIDAFVAVIDVLVFVFACYLLYDAVGFVVDTKELFVSVIFFALCFLTLLLLKYRKSALLVSGIVLLIFGGFVFSKYAYSHRAGTAIVCRGDLVFQPSPEESSPDAICFSPLRPPHWYESGVEVDFIAGTGSDANCLAEQKLIGSGAAKLVKKLWNGSEEYRVRIPRKLFLEWR
jgi:hypothetical protein